MKDDYVIGLDFGTLSGRGVLVRCSDGHVMSEAMKEYEHGVMNEYLPDGKTELAADFALEHPQDYLDVLEHVVPSLLKDSSINADSIVGVGIDFTSCTMLPVDEDAVPLCMKPEFASRPSAYVKLWKHHGAAAQASRVNDVLNALGLAQDFRFGGKCSSELMIPKVMETLQDDPQVYDCASEFLEAGDWLTRVLTGSHRRSSSMAGYKLWWNESQGYPSEHFFAALDERLQHFIRDKAPGEICAMGQAIGTLNHEWAARLGLRAGIAVAPSIIDSHAGMPGSGVADPSSMMLVLGTSSVVAALSDDPFSGSGIMGGVRDAVVPGYYAYESGLACVGDLFAWYVDNMLPANITREAEARGMNIFAVLNERAERLSTGESGLLALDWWNGNKTPFIDSELSGVIAGLTLRTKPEEIYKALIEATAFATRSIVEIFHEHGVKANEIIASGGISLKNPLLVQIYADVLGKNIRVSGSTQAAALGAAIYAALAAGVWPSYSEAVKHMSPATVRTYQPDTQRHETYDRLYSLYVKYRNAMGKDYAEILHELKR